MTVTSPPHTATDPGRGRRGPTSAAEQARLRREKRHAKIAAAPEQESLLVRARRSARQLPFVLLLVGLIGAGLAGVLWLNTLTDQAGMQASAARRASADLQLQIEGISSDIAARNATPAIAQAAQSLGMVPAGDAAILIVPDPADPSATPTQLGEGTAVADPAVIAAQEAAAAAASAQAAAAASASAAAQASADAAAAAAAAQTTTAAVTPVDPATGVPADAATTTGAVG